MEVAIFNRFCMASNLRSLMLQPAHSQLANEFAPFIHTFISTPNRGGMARSSTLSKSRADWDAVPLNDKKEVITLDDVIYAGLKTWSERNANLPPIGRRVILCKSIRKHGVAYSTADISKGDCQIAFKLSTNALPLAGRIVSILEEAPALDQDYKSRIFIMVYPYQQLSQQEQTIDIYAQNPVVGDAGLALCRLYKNSFEAKPIILTPDDLISNIATCLFSDPSLPEDENYIVTMMLKKVSG